MSSKAKRTEFRIVKMLCEYTLPDDITEEQVNKLIDEIHNPDEIDLPREVLKMDLERTQLLSIAVNDDKQGESCSEEEAFGFLSQTLVNRFPLEDLAYQLALEDMKTNYESEIKEYPNFINGPVFYARVNDRKAWYIVRMTDALSKLFENQKS